MFKNMKLSLKLYVSFGILLILILAVAGNSVYSVKGLLSTSEDFAESGENKTFMVEKEVDHLKWINKVNYLFVQNLPTLNVQLDHTKCGLGRFLYGEAGKHLAESDHKAGDYLEAIKEPHIHLHQSGKHIKEVWRQRHTGLRNLLKDRLDDHRRWAAEVSRMVIEHDPDIEVQLDGSLCAFGKFLASQEYLSYAKDFPTLREVMERAKGPHHELHESARTIKAKIKAGDYKGAERVYEEVTQAKLEEVSGFLKEAIAAETKIAEAQGKAHEIFMDQTLPSLEATQAKMKALKDHLAANQAQAQETMAHKSSRSQISAVVVTVVAFLVGVLVSFFLTRSITRPINRIIEGLSEGSEQVAAASNQVSSSSQQLAEGASEQAASLEETSSSLEEMASMTRQNADNANQADRLMKEANQVVSQANESMGELTTSMQDISEASEETQKIIKTIDEIAFQTNLLALNAAVEAARAGEAGAGFAVVADEVRNLAMRAADAAKNTAELIEGTVKKIHDGSELVDKTNGAFSEVATSAAKVGELVGEIAAASNEQAQGIDQVNRAVAEMDKVTQQTAGNAEESASASEEMNAQAEHMKGYVGDLVALVGDTSNGRENGRSLTAGGPSGTLSHKALGFEGEGGKKRGEGHSKGVSKEVKPEEVIPLDEDDFKDF